MEENELSSLSYPDFCLDGKVAVVTGAARGIGRHTALSLAKYGADVVGWDLAPDEFEPVATQIEKFGRQSKAQRVDITSIPEIYAAAEAVLKDFDRVDILVNSAGLNRPQWAEDVPEENWDLIMNTNIKGLFFCCQALGKIMIKQKKGKIINISSDAGVVGLIKRAAYCSSKGGVTQLTKVLAIEWAKHNINVNAVGPAFIATPFTEPMLKDPETYEYVMQNTPLKCVGNTVDVAAAVLYLAAPVSDYVTGHTLMVDGGWTAH
jgi:NAD(P)-dependent dehydrogenase (short-subunit alcohol dehydrogenase family)